MAIMPTHTRRRQERKGGNHGCNTWGSEGGATWVHFPAETKKEKIWMRLKVVAAGKVRKGGGVPMGRELRWEGLSL